MVLRAYDVMWGFFLLSFVLGYGKYNKKMLVFYMPLTMTTLFCTSSASFILPAIRCNFDLTAFDEGCLYGAVYIGWLQSKLYTTYVYCICTLFHLVFCVHLPQVWFPALSYGGFLLTPWEDNSYYSTVYCLARLLNSCQDLFKGIGCW